MPTVREGIEPDVFFPTPKGKRTVKSLRVFPAERWEKWGGKPGQWRIMLGETWVRRKGERVSFFSEDGVRAFGGDWMLQAMGIAAKAKPVAPVLAKGSKVLVRQQLPKEAAAQWVKSYTRTKPFVDEYGDWRVWVFLRKTPVLISDLERLADGSGYRLEDCG